MPTDIATGIVKNLNSLLMVGLPQSHMRGSITPTAGGASPAPRHVDDEEFRKNVQQYNQSNQKQTGISLPKLIGDYRSGTMAPVLYNSNPISSMSRR